MKIINRYSYNAAAYHRGPRPFRSPLALLGLLVVWCVCGSESESQSIDFKKGNRYYQKKNIRILAVDALSLKNQFRRSLSFKSKKAEDAWLRLDPLRTCSTAHARLEHFDQHPQPHIPLNDVDVRHNSKISLIYDPIAQRYRNSNEIALSSSSSSSSSTSASASASASQSTKAAHLFFQQTKIKCLQIIHNSFLPEGVTPSYYKFIKWNILQRFISANVHVIGTQSLLMGLGIQNKGSTLGLSIALNWVLKDALGKIVRMVWASRMGRKFDPDAKRWRFRSSLLFAMGNGLEVMTYIFPPMFLILATMANSFKQMSMLTNTATRNALYNSFRDMDGGRENIGDITAKGEAQRAIVDLMGILSGVLLSKSIGTSVRSVLTVWIALQITDLTIVYNQLRSVVFRVFNFERLWTIMNSFLDGISNNNADVHVKKSYATGDIHVRVPTPDTLAREERMFLPPNRMARKGVSFGTLGRAKIAPDEIQNLISIFRKDKFLLVCGKNHGKQSKLRASASVYTDTDAKVLREQIQQHVKENCHIVLHRDATNRDIVKGSLALAILRRKLGESVPTAQEIRSMSMEDEQTLEKVIDVYTKQRSRDCMEYIRLASKETDRLFGIFLQVVSERGWASPTRYMSEGVTKRSEWPIRHGSNAQT